MHNCHLYFFFDDVSIKVFGQCFNEVFFSYFFSLYFLDYNTLLDVSFADIFSKSVSCFLILLSLYFA